MARYCDTRAAFERATLGDLVRTQVRPMDDSAVTPSCSATLSRQLTRRPAAPPPHLRRQPYSP
jgi:hypothetical protein